MRKSFLLLLFSLSYFTSISQEWSPIKLSDSIHYPGINYDTILNSFFIDSTEIIGSDTILYFAKVLNEDSMSFGHAKSPISVNKVFGKSVLLKSDTLEFQNQYGTPITLAYKTSVGNSWLLMKTDSIHYYIKVDSIGLDTVNEEVDSIKYCRLICKDTLGKVLNIHSNKGFRLSKNHGMTTYANWYYFPEYILFDTIDSRIYTKLNHTRRDFYNYSLNDEYQIETKFSYYNSANHYRRNIEDFRILEKQFSINEDTVFYKQEVNKAEIIPLSFPGPNNPNAKLILDTIYYKDTIEFYYTDLDDLALNALSNYPYFVGDSGILKNYISNHTYNNRIYQISDRRIFFLDSLGWSEHLRRYDRVNELHEVEGVGVFYQYIDYDQQPGSYGYREKKKITYYKSGNEIWGKRRLITTIPKNSSKKNQLRIFPNPNNGLLKIQFTQDHTIVGVKLFDLLGKEHDISILKENSKTYRLDIREQTNGIYILQLQFSNGELLSKKFIKK